MRSSVQRELIDLKTNSVLKTKFNELSAVPRASEIPDSSDVHPMKISQN